MFAFANPARPSAKAHKQEILSIILAIGFLHRDFPPLGTPVFLVSKAYARYHGNNRFHARWRPLFSGLKKLNISFIMCSVMEAQDGRATFRASLCAKLCTRLAKHFLWSGVSSILEPFFD